VYSCREVAKYIASDEYLTAGLLKRLAIRLHLAMCEHCSRYLRQLRKLAGMLREAKNGIPPSEIEDAKSRIMERLSRKP
jgi:predicted anti-sigma-YlaC factor YlaD